MSTAGDPAVPTVIEPRTPTPYLSIGAVALGAAAISLFWLAVLIYDAPQSPITLLALAPAVIAIINFQIGLWGLQQHRYGQRAKASTAAADARYMAWVNDLAKQTAYLEAISLRVDQLSSRVGWAIQQIAPERRSDSRPAPAQRSRQSRNRAKEGQAPPRPTPAGENVVELPSQETMRAARGLARRVIRGAGDNPGDNNSM
jgi:hypothetical protein